MPSGSHRPITTWPACSAGRSARPACGIGAQRADLQQAIGRQGLGRARRSWPLFRRTAASGKPAASPAPASIAHFASQLDQAGTDAGTSATRRSPGNVSLNCGDNHGSRLVSAKWTATVGAALVAGRITPIVQIAARAASVRSLAECRHSAGFCGQSRSHAALPNRLVRSAKPVNWSVSFRIAAAVAGCRSGPLISRDSRVSYEDGNRQKLHGQARRAGAEVVARRRRARRSSAAWPATSP